MERSHAQRLLDRATFGARPGERARARGEDPEAWLAAQLAAARLPDDPLLRSRLSAFATLDRPGPSRLWAGLGALPDEIDAALAERSRPPAALRDPEARREIGVRARHTAREVAGARVVRALHGTQALREVMIDFWSNHFSVDARKSFVGGLLPHYQRQVLEPHSLGRFEDLLLATARSPAMLVYLDNWRSTARREPRNRHRQRERAGRQRGGINENYARELLELHTLGVDGGYTQEDVVEVARALTGWGIAGDGGFAFRPRLHVAGSRRVLGSRVTGDGVDEGEALLRMLARHPSTARHVARKLAVRFVADDPAPALVERAALRFLETEGSIPEVLRVVLLSPELGRGEDRKLKTPLRFSVSALRATGGECDGGNPTLLALARLGELPFYAKTPAGHPETAARWIDPGSMLERMSFAFSLARGWIRGSRLGRDLPEGALAGDLAQLPASERVATAIAAPEFQWT